MAHVSLIPVTDLHRWERNPRLHPDTNIAQLCASLREFGLARLPVLATWPGQTEGCIIAGNGITAALKRMYEADPAHPPQGVDPGSPWMIPVRPRTFDSQLAAEKYGLVDNWSTEASEDDPLLVAPILQELQAFGDDLTGLFLSVDEVGILLGMPDPDGTPEGEGQGDGSDGDASDADSPIGDSKYTTKIKIPVYEPKGKKPEVTELFNNAKTLELRAEIDAANLPDEVAAFMRIAADRHTSFHFRNIAEFYAHADAKTQALMERSALVIIDYNKAVENGFVKMSERLRLLVKEEAPKDA
jgi:hypothetical protein